MQNTYMDFRPNGEYVHVVEAARTDLYLSNPSVSYPAFYSR